MQAYQGALALIGVVVLATGCASSSPPSTAGTSSTQGSTLVRAAVVTEVRDITEYRNQHGTAGSVVGAILGGLAGSTIGSGYGQGLATVGGAAVGSLAGQRLASTQGNAITRVTVRTTNGALETHEVGADEAFRVGETVNIVTNNNRTYLTR